MYAKQDISCLDTFLPDAISVKDPFVKEGERNKNVLEEDKQIGNVQNCTIDEKVVDVEELESINKSEFTENKCSTDSGFYYNGPDESEPSSTSVKKDDKISKEKRSSSECTSKNTSDDGLRKEGMPDAEQEQGKNTESDPVVETLEVTKTGNENKDVVISPTIKEPTKEKKNEQNDSLGSQNDAVSANSDLNHLKAVINNSDFSLSFNFAPDTDVSFVYMKNTKGNGGVSTDHYCKYNLKPEHKV